jgi:hypothetical protein
MIVAVEGATPTWEYRATQVLEDDDNDEQEQDDSYFKVMEARMEVPFAFNIHDWEPTYCTPTAIRKSIYFSTLLLY